MSLPTEPCPEAYVSTYSPVGILCAVDFWAIAAEITQQSHQNSHGALESSYGHCLNKFLMHYHAQIPWNRQFSAMNRSDSDHCLRRPIERVHYCRGVTLSRQRRAPPTCTSDALLSPKRASPNMAGISKGTH